MYVIILGYLYFWGVMFMIITTLVAIFKAEKNHLTKTDSIHFSIVNTYKLLFDIIKLNNVRKLAIILLTIKVSK